VIAWFIRLVLIAVLAAAGWLALHRHAVLKNAKRAVKQTDRAVGRVEDKVEDVQESGEELQDAAADAKRRVF
jgi:hypothetical protein